MQKSLDKVDHDAYIIDRRNKDVFKINRTSNIKYRE